jgi:hypothetical protein
MKAKTFYILPAAVLAACWAFLAPGCNSVKEPRDLMMEEAAAARPIERPVAMRGEATYLAGKIAATATVRRGFERVNKKGEMGPPPKGAGFKKNPDDEISSFTHVYFGGVSEEEQKAEMESYVRMAEAQRAAGSPMPPVTLRVQLENRGMEPMEVEVSEVSSDLGNFAPRPAGLSIPPGTTATLDPMISQLGVTSDNIPLKLTVRTGGKSETQILAIQNIISAAAQKEFDDLQKQQKKKK